MKDLSKKLLQEIVRRLVDALHPEGIYLFGSHASGQADDDGDVDLLVVVADGNASMRDLARQGRQSLQGLRVPVDLVVCTESEVDKWSKVGCNLIHTVVEKGQLVYVPGS